MSEDEALKTDIVRYAQSGRAILIAGAGLSYGAHNAAGENIPGTSEMTTRILEFVGIKQGDRDGFNFSTAMQALEDKERSSSKVAQYLYQHFHACEVAEHHKTITSIPWYRIYTTNYDDVIEQSSEENGIHCEVFDQGGTVKAAASGDLQVIHLHGAISRTNPTQDPDRFVGSIRAYSSTSHIESDWFRQFKKDCENSPAIFVVGNSLSDQHVAQALMKNPEICDKVHFILGENPPLSLRYQIQAFTENCHYIGVEKFGALLRNLPRVSENISTPPRNLNRVSKAIANREARSTDCDKLFLLGQMDESLMMQDISDPKDIRYFCQRFSQDIQKFEKNYRIAIAHSDLGNGKSVFCREIALKSESNGRAAFYFEKDKGNIIDAVNFLRSLNEPVCVVFDNFFSVTDEFNELSKVDGDILFVLSARTPQFDARISEFETRYAGQYKEFDLNKISNNSADILSSLFDQFGYWRELSVAGQEDKLRYLMNKCDGEFRSILLSLLDSPAIRRRFDAFFEQITGLPERLLEFVVISAYHRHATGNSLSSHDIGLVMGFDYISEIRSNRRLFDEEIFSKNFDPTFKSSVFAEYFLREILDNSYLKEVLVRYIRNFDIFSDNRDALKPDFRNIARFSVLARVFSGAAGNSFVDEIFDNLHSIKSAQNDPLFWVQASIAKSRVKGFPKAESYIDVARAKAKSRPKFDTYQIDTHEAHFLIDSRLNGFKDDYNEAFLRAVRLIDGVVARRPDDVFHPVQVCARFWDFYSVHKEAIDEFAVKEIRDAIARLLEQIERSPMRSIKNKRISERAKYALNEIYSASNSYR